MASRPHLDFLIVAASHHDPASLLKLHIRDELIMRQYRVNNSLLPEIPDLNGVIVAASGDLVGIGEELNRDDLADVGRELQDGLSAAQVPDQADSVQVTSAQKAAVPLERH